MQKIIDVMGDAFLTFLMYFGVWAACMAIVAKYLIF